MAIVLLIAIVLVFVAVAKSGNKLRTLGAIVGGLLAWQQEPVSSRSLSP